MNMSLTVTKVVHKWLTLSWVTSLQLTTDKISHFSILTYSPPRSMHLCHSSGNFQRVAVYRSLGYCTQHCGHLSRAPLVGFFSHVEWFVHYIEQIVVRWDLIWIIWWMWSDVISEGCYCLCCYVYCCALSHWQCNTFRWICSVGCVVAVLLAYFCPSFQQNIQHYLTVSLSTVTVWTFAACNLNI